MTACELRPGMVLVTQIGRAPIKSISPKASGFEVVLDVDAEDSTRAPAQGSVLFFWPSSAVKVSRNALAPRVPRPLANDRGSATRAPCFGRRAS